jgi:superfamily II DNA or RNA helicase
MRKINQLLEYMQAGAQRLLEQGGFDNGWEFKVTQSEAVRAYINFLRNENLSAEERLEGFFDIATGVGKTAIFVAIVHAASRIAQENKDDLRSVIVVPTKILLKQTADSFNTYAPNTVGHIGFYGDGHKNLKQPITLMTYNAWTELSKSGTISADNVDLLISDEAHRGTSEERVFLSKTFNGIVRLAFTASSEFDNEKAVYNSHKHKVYYKSLAEAVKGGELANYIQVQFHVIRAKPSRKLQDQFEDNNSDINGEAKRKLKQAAWTKWAVRYYREGRDNITGDLVSDNQASFFVDDTTHADRLERALNSDEGLMMVARSRNCAAVAVAVHSRISKKEQEQRLEAYKAGMYLAVIGDSMLKEGFDHDRMKTVIDWPHGSLVDKVQILGRGARKWFNETKNRFEGLVFADTIIYVGSGNPTQDALNRDQAIRNAILASDVLDGVFVFDAKIKDENTRKGGTRDGRHPSPFAGDPDVEEYTTLESIKTLLGERANLRNDKEVMDAYRQANVTLKDIKDAIDGYRKDNNGRNPSGKAEGLVKHGFLAGKVGWVAVCAFFFRGSKGLCDDPEFQQWSKELSEKGLQPSLSEFLKKLNYSERLSGIIHQYVTIEGIKSCVKEYRKNNNSQNPTTRSGKIEYGPYAGMITWGGLRSVIVNGAYGLSEDPEYQSWTNKLKENKLQPSLAEFMIEFGFQDRSLRLQERPSLTFESVRQSVIDYLESRQGKRPNGRMKELISTGSLKDHYTWVAVNAALMSGNNGLSADPEWKEWSDKLKQENITPSLPQLIKICVPS